MDNTDLLQLRLLAQQKQLTEYKAAKDAKLVTLAVVALDNQMHSTRNVGKTLKMALYCFFISFKCPTAFKGKRMKANTI